MIYLDNAATTMRKPPEVAKAVARALDSFGDVGRGVHDASMSAGLTVFKARQQISRLLGGPDPRHVTFTLNVTEALNTVIQGILGPDDHAVTTAASHNSVLRPLYRKQDREGTGLAIVPVSDDGSVDLDLFEDAFEPNTRLAVVTHASNLTGDLYDMTEMARIAHAHGALLVVDSAQTAGSIPIDMGGQGIDIVCFTGHKGLFGPQGTGGICLARDIDIEPLKVGGTGTRSYDREHPSFLPEHLEAGTLNAHGIAGLSAGLSFIEETGVGTIHDQVEQLTRRFLEGVSTIPRIRVLGKASSPDRCGIVALNIGDVDSAQVSDMLSVAFGIATRAGAHCAPLMHEALGTDRQGAVRFSFSYFNTIEEIDTALDALRSIEKSLV